MEWLEKLATCTCKCCISVWCQYYVHFVVSIENSRAYYITIYAAGALHCILLFGSKRAIYNTLKKIRKLNRTSLCRVSVCVTCQFVSRVFFVSRVGFSLVSVCVSCLFVSRVNFSVVRSNQIIARILPWVFCVILCIKVYLIHHDKLIILLVCHRVPLTNERPCIWSDKQSFYHVHSLFIRHRSSLC